MKAYWARGEGRGNFGDELTPLLFGRIGVELEWAEREDADLFAIGSIAELIPSSFTGYVLGTGCMFTDPVAFSDAQVLALRGIFTARLAGLRPVLLADMGLLAPDLLGGHVKRTEPVGTCRAGGDPRPAIGVALDPSGDPVEMIRAAASCQRIVSSSLHGLILADALGIPNMWDPYPGVAEFKFRDYASAFGERIEPYVWRLADQVQVQSKQEALREAMGMVA